MLCHVGVRFVLKINKLSFLFVNVLKENIRKATKRLLPRGECFSDEIYSLSLKGKPHRMECR